MLTTEQANAEDQWLSEASATHRIYLKMVDEALKVPEVIPPAEIVRTSSSRRFATSTESRRKTELEAHQLGLK